MKAASAHLIGILQCQHGYLVIAHVKRVKTRTSNKNFQMYFGQSCKTVRDLTNEENKVKFIYIYIRCSEVKKEALACCNSEFHALWRSSDRLL